VNEKEGANFCLLQLNWLFVKFYFNSRLQLLKSLPNVLFEPLNL